jgi:hypothetical protein
MTACATRTVFTLGGSLSMNAAIVKTGFLLVTFTACLLGRAFCQRLNLVVIRFLTMAGAAIGGVGSAILESYSMEALCVALSRLTMAVFAIDPAINCEVWYVLVICRLIMAVRAGQIEVHTGFESVGTYVDRSTGCGNKIRIFMATETILV